MRQLQLITSYYQACIIVTFLFNWNMNFDTEKWQWSNISTQAQYTHTTYTRSKFNWNIFLFIWWIRISEYFLIWNRIMVRKIQPKPQWTIWAFGINCLKGSDLYFELNIQYQIVVYDFLYIHTQRASYFVLNFIQLVADQEIDIQYLEEMQMICLTTIN